MPPKVGGTGERLDIRAALAGPGVGAGEHPHNTQPVLPPLAAPATSTELRSPGGCCALHNAAVAGARVAPPQPWSFFTSGGQGHVPAGQCFLLLGKRWGWVMKAVPARRSRDPRTTHDSRSWCANEWLSRRARPSFSTNPGFPPAWPQRALAGLRIASHARAFPCRSLAFHRGAGYHLIPGRFLAVVHFSPRLLQAGLVLHRALNQ